MKNFIRLAQMLFLVIYLSNLALGESEIELESESEEQIEDQTEDSNKKSGLYDLNLNFVTSAFNEIQSRPPIELTIGCVITIDLKPVPFTNCRKFYRCGSGRLFTLDCPPGTYFDAQMRVCAHHSNRCFV